MYTFFLEESWDNVISSTKINDKTITIEHGFKKCTKISLAN